MAKGLKTGGREAGTPNKISLIQREFIQSLLDAQQDKIKNELNGLKGKDYIAAISSLMEFALPKLQRTELKTNNETFPTVIKIGYGRKNNKND
jgi:hypothetical protein